MSLLHLQNLSIEREIPILQKIDWRIQAGEHWVLLGPNGSGKTSLLAAITGYLSPTQGHIEVLGSVYGKTDWRQLRKKVGIVSTAIAQRIQPQETALHAVLSGRQAMINYWGNPATKEIAQAQNILKEMEAEALTDRPWAHLSQGERQRVLIGRAWMANYQILILDEPCAGLDMVARENFLEFLNRLAQKPTAPTMIFVTHHVEEIIPAFTHVLLLKAGKVQAAGAKSQVLNSKNLSQTFGRTIQLTQENHRYTAKMNES